MSVSVSIKVILVGTKECICGEYMEIFCIQVASISIEPTGHPDI